jgi:hypothetical protein
MIIDIILEPEARSVITGYVTLNMIDPRGRSFTVLL